MTHIKQLTHIQLRKILTATNLQIHNHPLLTKLLWLFLLAMTSFYSGGYTYLLIGILPSKLILSLYYAMISFLMMVSTIYFVHDLFIINKDQDLLNPLPIKKTTIIKARFNAIYLINLALCLIFMLPSYAILFYYKQPCLISLCLLPLQPIICMCLGLMFGYLIEYVASIFKHRQLLTTLLTFILIISIFALTSNLNENIELSTLSMMLLTTFKNIYYPTILYYNLLTEPSIITLLLFMSLNIIAYYSFILLASKLSIQPVKQVYAKKKVANTYSLVYLELNRYFHSVGYVTNTAVGYVLLFIGLFFINKTPQPLLPYAYLFLVGMATTTHVSFSLEGSYFWLKKSLPIPFKDIVKAKLLVTYILSIPSFIISSIVYLLHYGFSLPTFSLCFLGTLLFPILGLVINLFIYNFDNENDTIVVKQSFSSMLMVGSLSILSGLPLLASFYIKHVSFYTSLLYLLLLIICIFVIIKKGPLQYAKMPDSGK